MRWDPEQYDRFKRERSQPFHDLLARVPPIDARTIADLGCGDGELTLTLLDRWPGATITGVDSSEEMLAKARARKAPPSVRFRHGDLRTFHPESPLDLVVSNAALQWIPDHAGLLGSLAALLAPGGVLAVQVPNNHGETAYRLAAELAASLPPGPKSEVESLDFYRKHLTALGLDAEVWETVYRHPMASADGIVEWLKGSVLRPALTVLPEPDARGFLATLTERVRAAYPSGPDGVVFPFRRLFFVARRGRS
jgi:trans-aconitate 2-methyltransferase